MIPLALPQGSEGDEAYTVISVLGEGFCSKVHKVRRNSDDSLGARKMM